MPSLEAGILDPSRLSDTGLASQPPNRVPISGSTATKRDFSPVSNFGERVKETPVLNPHESGHPERISHYEDGRPARQTVRLNHSHHGVSTGYREGPEIRAVNSSHRLHPRLWSRSCKPFTLQRRAKKVFLPSNRKTASLALLWRAVQIAD
jgi:hypothetical protein